MWSLLVFHARHSEFWQVNLFFARRTTGLSLTKSHAGTDSSLDQGSMLHCQFSPEFSLQIRCSVHLAQRWTNFSNLCSTMAQQLRLPLFLVMIGEFQQKLCQKLVSSSLWQPER
jgi:hypothetical protein